MNKPNSRIIDAGMLSNIRSHAAGDIVVNLLINHIEEQTDRIKHVMDFLHENELEDKAPYDHIINIINGCD